MRVYLDKEECAIILSALDTSLQRFYHYTTENNLTDMQDKLNSVCNKITSIENKIIECCNKQKQNKKRG